MQMNDPFLKSPADVSAWLKAITMIHGEPIQHLAYPEDCAELVRQFAAAGVSASLVEAQAFWYAYCDTVCTGWMTPFKDCVGVLDELASNRRKDFLHKLSTQLVKNNGAIFIGNVNASELAKTGMAKSVLDAGWSMLRTQLQYKGDDAGCWVKTVDEAYSTQDCSCCGARTGPKGLAGLAVRRWICSDCGKEHDRDTNAALNIERRGLRLMELEFSAAMEAKACEIVVNKDPQGPGPDLAL